MPPSRARALLFADLALGLGGASAAGVSEALKECWETGADLAALLVERGIIEADGRARVEQALRDLLTQADDDADLALARRGGIDESIHAGLPAPVSKDVAQAGAPARPPLRTVAHGRYRQFKLISRGGMGLVYSVLDSELNRRVAFKMVLPEPRAPRDTPPPEAPLEATPPPDGDSDSARSFDELRVRFLQEAWITGAMEHPGVVPVYELGQTRSGIPYYTMRYLAGERTLKQALAECADLDARLRLLEPFLKILDTIRYAHARGVVHRDLKPENIVLGDFGEVVVLDWGLSKMEGRPDVSGHVWQGRIEEFRKATDLRTVAGALGTPGYMAPEAVTGRGENVGHTSDVYSLGVMLWEVLAGRLPYRFTTFLEFAQAILDDDPPPVSEVAPDVPEELGAIAMKALRRNPAERYATVDEMAAALRHWLSEGTVERRVQALLDEARHAVETSRKLEGNAQFWQLDRAARLCSQVLMLRPDHSDAKTLQGEVAARRHSGIRARVAGGRRELLKRTGGVVLAVAAIAALFVANVLRREQAEAEERVNRVRTELAAARGSLEVAQRDRRAAQRRLGHAYADAALREQRVGHVADAQLLAAAGVVTHADPETLAVLATLMRDAGPRLLCAVPGIDARALAFDGSGGTVVAVRADGVLERITVDDGARAELATLPADTRPGEPRCVAIAPDGARIAVGTTRRVFVFDPGREGAQVRALGLLPEPADPITDLAWLENGALVWTGHASGALVGWNANSAFEDIQPTVLSAHSSRVVRLFVEPQSGILWSMDRSGTVRSTNLFAPVPQEWGFLDLGAMQDFVVRRGEDGVFVRTCSETGEVTEWAVDSFDGAIRLLEASGSPRRYARFLADAGLLATVGADGAIETWDLRQARLLGGLWGGAEAPRACALEPGTGRLAVAGADGALRVWDLTGSPNVLQKMPACVCAARAEVLRVTPDLRVDRCAPDGRRTLDTSEAHESPVTAIACDAEGRRAVTADFAGTISVWDLESGDLAHVRKTGGATPTAVAIHDRGDRIVYGTVTGELVTWTPGAPRPVPLPCERRAAVTALAVDPGGTALAAGFSDGAVELWSLDRRELQETWVEAGHAPVAIAVDGKGGTAWYTADDRLLVTDGRVLHDRGRPARGATAIALELLADGTVRAVLLDGRTIAVAPDGTASGVEAPVYALALSGAGPSWIARTPPAHLIDLETRYGLQVEGLRVRHTPAERLAAREPRIAPWSDLR